MERKQECEWREHEKGCEQPPVVKRGQGSQSVGKGGMEGREEETSGLWKIKLLRLVL